jgi:hypothetical protein
MKPKRASQQFSTGCLSLFGLPFFAAGIFISWLYFSPIWNWWNAQRWVEVPCWIESAGLKESSGDDSTTYKAVASYHYIYQGKTYHGDRVSFSTGSDNVGDFQHDIHRELSEYAGKKPAGAELDPKAQGAEPFRCYVNPANPSEAVLYRSFRWSMLAFLAVFALTFPAVGAGLVIGGLMGIRIATKEAALRARHPEMPWKWKVAWAGDVIPESTGSTRRWLYAYTLWSGLVVLSLLATTAASGSFLKDPKAWFLAFFPLLWAIPLALSIKHLRHFWKVGATRFEPKEWPWWPGGNVQGDILLEKPLTLRSDGEAVLTCSKSVSSGSGDDRTTNTEVVWSQTRELSQDRMIRDLSGFRLPLSFTIPADAPETSGEGTDTTHRWLLEYKVPGTPIRSQFDIPVFRTGKSPQIPVRAGSDGSGSLLDEASVDLPAKLAARKIEASFDGEGHPLHFRCTPARHLSMILFLVVFDVVWTGAAVFLVKQNAPLIFQIVWPVSAALIWVLILWTALHSRKVSFDATGLLIENRLGPFQWKRAVEKSFITGFHHDSNMSSGNTRFYRIRLESVIGKKHVVIDGITESSTAEILTRRLDAWRARR